MAAEHACTIEVRVERIAQLFDTLDPVPFRERDLDKDAEEFIVGWARELPGGRPIAMRLHVPKAEAASEAAREVGHALTSYFRDRAAAVTNDLKELFRLGRYSLLIGLVVLAACITASRFAAGLVGTDGIGRFAEESLIIVGWVANWRPIEIFLYDWYPLVRRRALYRRLSSADVQLAPY
ncbi:MAG: hypothetical protein KGJ78_06540 [Alphaproteobacteria bacterium]|nr:hypothetical protein [Alphaproteobacteria bacterium]